MEQQPVRIPGPRFRTHAVRDFFRFLHPASKAEYTLTVQELEQQTLPDDNPGSDRWIYPTNYTVMSYTLSSETEDNIAVSECGEGDRPIIRKSPEPTSVIPGGSRQD